MRVKLNRYGIQIDFRILHYACNYSSVCALHPVLNISGRERVSLKSSYVKAPSDSKLLPSTLNRIRVNKSGYYTVFGNLCFSEKDITGKSESVIVTLEQVHSGFKSTIISKSEVVHWDPNSYVSVSFMENIWLNGATELLLFVNRPNVLYKFKDCNTIGIYKMH